MWGHTQVSLVLVALVVLATVVNTQKPINILDLPAGSSCTAHTGGPGTCLNIRKCPFVGQTYRLNMPVICGYSGVFPIVCCPSTGGDNTAAIGDISPPSVSFQCGTNPRKTFTLLLKSLGDEVILRPEATTSRPVAFERPTPSGESAISSRPRPGIPADAFNDPSARVERPLSSVKRQEGGLAAQAHPAGSLEPINGAVGFAVGGVIAEKNAWPWMALLGDTNEQGKITWFCAGALINEQWVLSALHCFLFTTVTVVRLGEHDYNDDGDGAVHEDFGVAETILHPDYVHPQGYHDLALLKLNRRVILKPFINPVCLPWGQESINDLTGTKVTLTGWGATQFAGEPSSVLQEVEITVFPSSDCDKSYSTLDDYLKKFPRGIGKETVCAGDRAGGRDACQSDSGGPLVSRNSAGQYTMAGVVSSGVGCGLKDFPGLYANIREEQYLAWVKKTAF
ncbi:clotting factor G beta subunit-like isoform X1 [Homarus americanus]|uniref:clotting factor G beta subunit-like isoform X1 n=1 Tax=Homarus americanus TaxID=6706 RepID=UPI001C437C8B|nr:clotting factor G beta subunit-like isoform X1 [Homarus americanus]